MTVNVDVFHYFSYSALFPFPPKSRSLDLRCLSVLCSFGHLKNKRIHCFITEIYCRQIEYQSSLLEERIFFKLVNGTDLKSDSSNFESGYVLYSFETFENFPTCSEPQFYPF